MRIALVADSHLAARAPECVANWRHAGSAAAAWQAELAIHLGDISLDGQAAPDELAFAAGLIAQWPTPMRCVPGNHDMGIGCGEQPIDDHKLAACEAAFGPGGWATSVDAWRLIGLNAQLLGSGSDAEERQWRWLERHVLSESAAHTALFLHRPLVRPAHDERMKTGRYVPDAARERLLGGPLRATLRAVFSGHVHQALDREVDGVRHVWLPSTGFVLPDAIQPRVGEKLVGLGLLELDGPRLRYDLLCPDGMRRHDAAGLSFWGELH